MPVLNHWTLLPGGPASLGTPAADGLVLCGCVEGHLATSDGLVTTSSAWKSLPIAHGPVPAREFTGWASRMRILSSFWNGKA